MQKMYTQVQEENEDREHKERMFKTRAKKIEYLLRPRYSEIRRKSPTHEQH